MKFVHRDAMRADLPRIVEIYNHAIIARTSTCDLDPLNVQDREAWFEKHNGSHRPIWVAEDADAPSAGVVGYLGFAYFLNERPGYSITGDIALYLHPSYQGVGLGDYLLGEALRFAPTLGIEVFAITMFASNVRSARLFAKHGFERWGYLPRVARLDRKDRDVVMMGLRLSP